MPSTLASQLVSGLDLGTVSCVCALGRNLRTRLGRARVRDTARLSTVFELRVHDVANALTQLLSGLHHIGQGRLYLGPSTGFQSAIRVHP